MKSQKHNEGELVALNVKIEKKLSESLDRMAKNSGLTIDEITVIALKRFRAAHSDYEDQEPDFE